VGDTYWMEGAERVDWIDTAPDFSVLKNKSPFLDNLIEDFIFQNAQYPVSNTGSHILMPFFRQNIIKVDFEPKKIKVAISLN
jgi:hypothetical protein